MPRLAMDYSKCVIYKIVCQDPEINECYVGHTTNFKSRKNQHKSNSKTSNFKLYQMIRDNGGWDNFTITPICEYPCENHIQACIKEEECRTELQASLNTHKCYVGLPQNEYDKIYREENKEQIKDYHKEYRQKNKEWISQKARLRYKQKLVQTENKNI
jgi:hypothetical protein